MSKLHQYVFTHLNSIAIGKEIYYLIYIYLYTVQLVCYVFHELCHWIMILPMWMIGLNSFPTIHIKRCAKVEILENGAYKVSSWYMYVSSIYNYSNLDGTFRCLRLRISAIAPFIGLIILFIISPIWLRVFLLIEFNNLSLSNSDYKQVFTKQNMFINDK
jgi:hypothetical protein